MRRVPWRLMPLFALLACQTLGFGPARIPECPVRLVSTTAMDAFRLRYHVAVEGARPESISAYFDLVAESRASVLTLVAWNRFGAQLFALQQRGTHVERVGPLLPGIPVSPERILADFQRLHFLGVAAAAPDGTRVVDACGTRTRFARVAEDPP